MGWNWVKNLAHHCNLHIITEGEWKDEIEEAVSSLPQGRNMTFYYNPVPDGIRAMCWNQGDWRFYYYYKKWQKETLAIARNIIAENPVDIVHQLNMVGFREPGYLWKIEDIPFVWGPIGGVKNFPAAYLKRASLKIKVVTRLKNVINGLQIKYGRRVNKALHRADQLISAIPETKAAISKHHGLNSVLIPETGCYIQDDQISHGKRSVDKSFKIIWVGKFDYRKQLGLALRTIAKIKYLEGVEFHVVGTGSEKQRARYKKLGEQLGLNSVVKWHGKVPHAEVENLMQHSQLFFFTSVSDETSTVVLEALSSHLPVLCFNACGYGPIVKGPANNSAGLTVEISNPLQSVNEFADKIKYLYNDRKVLSDLAANCIQRQKELSWGENAAEMVSLYEKIYSNEI
jgi:glycosyltransferase involved in cell wall biosynthesis